MATGKRFAELMGLTQAIEPTRTERKPGSPKTAPGQMIGALTGRDEALERAEKAEAELDALKSSLLIPLDQLNEVEGRRRNLGEEEYRELKSNILKHGLITPITVRRINTGGFEIVSGHNRVRAFRDLAEEDKDRFSRIKAYVDEESDAEKANELAFYANLLHPDLPDFEKYLGLTRVQAMHPELETARALAEHVGMSEQQVGRLLKAGALPEAAKELVQKNPKAFGAKALAQFAALAEQGLADRVIEAMTAVIEKGLDQSKAIDLAKAPKKTAAPAAPKAVAFTVKGSGNTKYCSVRAVKNVLRIEFANEADLAEVQDALKEVLDQRARLKKEHK